MRMVRFRGWLDQMHAASPIGHVVYEEVRRHLGTDAAHLYGGFMNLLLEWCEVHGIPAEAYPVGAIKKYWTGNGSASKELMISMCRQRGYQPRDDNEADAIAMLNMCLGGGL
jgi:Holliday junction resolvasome RuvABC endonuclease subunit